MKHLVQNVVGTTGWRVSNHFPIVHDELAVAWSFFAFGHSVDLTIHGHGGLCRQRDGVKSLTLYKQTRNSQSLSNRVKQKNIYLPRDCSEHIGENLCRLGGQ